MPTPVSATSTTTTRRSFSGIRLAASGYHPPAWRRRRWSAGSGTPGGAAGGRRGLAAASVSDLPPNVHAAFAELVLDQVERPVQLVRRRPASRPARRPRRLNWSRLATRLPIRSTSPRRPPAAAVGPSGGGGEHRFDPQADGGERVVQFVGDAGGQFADGGQLGRLPELLRHRLDLGALGVQFGQGLLQPPVGFPQAPHRPVSAR